MAADVHDATGALLLRAGGVVSERLLGQLATRGVKTLPVETQEQLSPEALAERRAAVAADLEKRFACVRDEPLMRGANKHADRKETG